MSKKYSDGFFIFCDKVINVSKETISASALSKFMGIPKSTMLDGLRRVETATNSDAYDVFVMVGRENKDGEVFDKGVEHVIAMFFSGDNPKLQHIESDEYIKELFTLTPNDYDDFDVDFEMESKQEEVQEVNEFEVTDDSKRADDESIEEYAQRLARQKQKAQDQARVERAAFRHQSRSINTIEEINNEIHKLLKARKGVYSSVPSPKVTTQTERVGVIQLSDLHFGELVKETISNRYDLEIASKRLQKMVDRCRKHFHADGITHVAVMLTGDLINSTRRISEITTYADARVKVVFNAYLILGALLEDLHQDFVVSVANVVGNESRLSEYFDTTNYLVSDNFDLMLFRMLKHTHEKPTLRFLQDESNPMEQVVDVNGVNFLLVHGNGHRGLATTPKIETEVEKIKARYAANGVVIGYVVCGHIHSTFISNNYARSASLTGSNAFSERNLNFTSKASQNAYIVGSDGSIDGFMVDLQRYEGYDGYEYDSESVMYTNDNEVCNVVIQKVYI